MKRFFLPFYQAVAPLSTKSPFIHKLLCVLTSRCNSRCPVCFLWGEAGLNNDNVPGYLKQELPPDIWNRFLREALAFTPAVVLTGGEVMIYEGLPEVLKEISRAKRYTHLITNGTLFPENLEAVLQGVGSLQLSIDGYDEKTHQTARPKESLKRKTELIRQIADYAKSNGRPELHIGVTISPSNFNALEEIIHFIESLRVSLCVTVLHQLFTTSAQLKQHYDFLQKQKVSPSFFFNGFVAQPGNIDGNKVAKAQVVLQKKRFRFIQRIEWVPHLTPEETKRYYADPSFIPYHYKRQCLAPWLELDIMPSGDAYSCPDFHLGNIAEHSFKELWNNESARRMRHLVQQEGTFPGCRVCASLYEYS